MLLALAKLQGAMEVAGRIALRHGVSIFEQCGELAQEVGVTGRANDATPLGRCKRTGTHRLLKQVEEFIALALHDCLTARG